MNVEMSKLVFCLDRYKVNERFVGVGSVVFGHCLLCSTYYLVSIQVFNHLAGELCFGCLLDVI